MTMHNVEIADIFDRVADLLEIEGANPFRVRAYRTAARTINSLSREVATLLEEGKDLSELPGIGKDLAAKIAEIVATEHLAQLDELEHRVPPDLAALVRLPGLGPKRAKQLHDALGIESLDDLLDAAQAGKVRELPGFGAKTEKKLLEGLAKHRDIEKRMLRASAEQFARPLLEYLKSVPGVKQAVIAGSYRRGRETVGDIDMLITCRKTSPVMERFVGYDEVAEVVSKGSTRATVYLRSGLQVDLRVVPEQSYGSALHYFTGSKAHNIAVRGMGVKKGLKINEYGVFKGKKRIAGRTEEDVYASVGLPYIEPELRENRGEIEAALGEGLPSLVDVTDLRGDLHTHTRCSDGRNSIEEMAKAAKERGYEYLAISDHTQHTRIAHGLNAKRLAEQLDEIDRVNETIKGITILKSAELDILDDGALDLPDSILRRLDLVVGAIHYKFDLPIGKQTRRILRAMDDPCITILAHPTGRMLGEREPYQIDIETVIDGARERGCFLEVNGQPERLDLTDIHCRLAKERGMKLSLATDAHSTDQLDFIRHAVGQARRGWIGPADVLNARPLKELRKLLKRL